MIDEVNDSPQAGLFVLPTASVWEKGAEMATLESIVQKINSLSDLQAEIQEVKKVNVTKRAIRVSASGENVGVLVYEEQLNSGDHDDPEKIANQIIESFDELVSTKPDYNMLMDSEWVLLHTFLRVCRANWNKERTLTHPVGDTDLVFYPVIKTGKWAAEITQTLFRGLNLPEGLLWDKAVSNTRTETQVTGFDQVMECAGVKADEYIPVKMFLISNDELNQGAAGGLLEDVLEEIRRKIGCSELLILPSSVHEMIVMEATPELNNVSAMIEEVNDYMLSPEEVLSNHPYIWDGKTLRNG